MVSLEKNSANKAKQHTVYKNKEGKRVPGTTTITGIMNKPALVGWANNLGLEGIKVREYVDDLAQIGTLAHYMVECHINSKIMNKEMKPNLDDSTPNQTKSAETSFNKFLNWESKNEVIYISSEKQAVSEEHQYGGMIDIYCMLNNVYTLLDIKTCKAIYPDHFLQVGGGYFPLLKEQDLPVEEARIIRIGRSEEEGIEAEDRLIPDLEKYQKLFLMCKSIYDIKKELKWR